ncbi:MAG: hypothetical protein HQK83_01870 [Fibrobacteria bacterium]|nr:hypothetical protein [Fibrobacteria bacterium]
MEQFLEFAKGSLFAGSFVIMVLGLARTAFITLWGTKNALDKAGDKNIPYKALIKETFEWMIPIKHITNSRSAISIVSVVFHIGLIIVPLFLLDHILLWQKLGLSWPGIPAAIANVLTITTIVTGGILLLNRIFHRDTRFLSSVIDYALLVLILAIFINGFIASKPFNPIPYNLVMVIHVMAGNLILILVPFSKLAHCFLYPIMRIASNIAWHFPARAGEEVNKTLYGEENKKV